MHVGSNFAPKELIEFDNNLVGVRNDPKERKEFKDVLVALALMGEMIGDQCRLRRRNNENAKLIAEEAVLQVRETDKIQELHRLLKEIPEAKKMEKLQIRQEVEKEWGWMEECLHC